MNDRDPMGLAFIDAYLAVLVDEWGVQIDQEDGSTAPFSALAAMQAEGVRIETCECLEVVSE